MVMMLTTILCREETLTIVAMLSTDSVLVTPNHKVLYMQYHHPVNCEYCYQKEQANAMRNKLISLDGDHMMLINIYKAYKAVKGNKVGVFVVILCKRSGPLIRIGLLHDIIIMIVLAVVTCNNYWVFYLT